MSVFKLPQWINPHLYSGKEFFDLSQDEVDDLKTRLQQFNESEPDVSIVIPAWNEEKYLYRTLSSLTANITSYKVEIVVVNNRSTDRTQDMLDRLGVKTYFQPQQGTSFARQLGLEKAGGKYHLCADADTLYPPGWIDAMVGPMEKDPSIVCVYGRYSFIPSYGEKRWGLFLYETASSIVISIRKINHEFMNVLGFNMAFVTELGRSSGGFKVKKARIFDNALGSEHFVEEAEDGTMALNLSTKGRIKQLTDVNARAFTSSRRLAAEGGVFKSFLNRIKFHGARLNKYFSGKDAEITSK